MTLYTPRSDAENQQLAALAAVELGVTFSPPYLALASLDAAGCQVGVVVLNGFDGNNIDVTIVGRHAFMPGTVRGVAKYIFVQLNCSRATLRTRRSNHRVRKILKRHFKFEVVLKGWFGSEDAFQFRMCRGECPWLGKRLEKKNGLITVAPAAA